VIEMKDAAYWMALAHLPKWGHQKINDLIIKFHHDQKISIEEFFNLSEDEWRSNYTATEQQLIDLKNSKSELAGLSFLGESLLSQGYEIIPITSPEYSKTLKANLKAAHSPAVLYVKGNKKILNERSVAIVGSRDASQRALGFTDNIAKLASKEYKVVVSGFAKGVDKQALDSAIKYKGQSIIVLPQGIMTFGSGFKTYYSQIIEGDVLVLSTFMPKAGWSTKLAMARNPIIYGLADEIFVAESSEKGGTWSGVIDGLRKNRKIFVRKPEPQESNANDLLIQKGAIAVDSNGHPLLSSYPRIESPVPSVSDVNAELSIDERLRSALQTKAMTAQELLKKLGLDWKPARLKKYLQELEFVELMKVNRKLVYKIRRTSDASQSSLFS
jgi:DNA processing protein